MLKARPLPGSAQIFSILEIPQNPPMSFKTLYIVLAFVAVAALLFFMFGRKTVVANNLLMTTAEKGAFTISVTATGELKAKRSVKIRGPQTMRASGIYQTTIADIVSEGTVVQEGEYVATLDRTELANKMSDARSEIEKTQTQLDQAKIDTAIELRGIRDNLVNLKFANEEKKLEVDQSKFEPQMVIRRAEIELEKIEREHDQLLSKYDLKKQQSLARVQEIQAQFRQNQNKLDQLSELSGGFQIMAPKSGMVIYSRGWDGKKTAGSQISAWDPVVAELPDLTDMISKTYVNEVDISKVRMGQDVRIKIDAFPDLEYSGQVVKVANIGEQLRNQDSKVFEVVVQVNEVDSIMRPAMTTSNEIITDVFDEVLYIPLEALHIDSLSFVYALSKGQNVKKEVITGESNDSEIIIAHGLFKNDEIYLQPPEQKENLKWEYLDTAAKEDILLKLEASRKERLEAHNEKQKQVKNVKIDDSSNEGGFMIVN